MTICLFTYVIFEIPFIFNITCIGNLKKNSIKNKYNKNVDIKFSVKTRFWNNLHQVHSKYLSNSLYQCISVVYRKIKIHITKVILLRSFFLQIIYIHCTSLVIHPGIRIFNKENTLL
jgi:hypothetical protein